MVKDIFIGECRKSNSGTIVIKTHLLPRRHRYTYDKVALLVRNPFDAIVAEYNRILVGKLAVAPRQAFQSEREYWIADIQRYLKVKLGNDQEMAHLERNSHSKNRGGKNNKLFSFFPQ